MNRETFNSCFAALVAAFRNADNVTIETQDVHYEILKEIPDDLFVAGVKKYIAEKDFFPNPHQLGVASCGEQKEEVVTREDPWRTRQFYQEKLPAISWQDNLKKILQRRNLLIEGPDKEKLEELASRVFGSPKVNPEVQKLQAKFDELDHRYEMLLQENFRLKRENDALKEKPKQSTEERRAQLKEQLEMLNGGPHEKRPTEKFETPNSPGEKGD